MFFFRTRVVHLVQLHLFTILILCCDMLYNFRTKRCSVYLYSHLLCMSSCFFLMLFVYIYKYCHPTRFPYHMMFVTFTCNTTGISNGAGTAYHSGASEFTPLSVEFMLFSSVLYRYVLLRFTASDIFKLVFY